MKKILLTGALALSTFTWAVAQTINVPNADFEDWTLSEATTQMEPDHYITIDAIIASFFGAAVTDLVQQESLDKYSGMYAIKLISDTLPTPQGTFSLPGLIMSGDDISQFQGGFGVDFSHRPSKLKGFYKYAGKGDTCQITVLVSKWNEERGEREYVGQGTFMTDDTTGLSYEEFSIDIEYNEGFEDVPDTLAIIAQSSLFDQQNPEAHQVTPGATLLLDAFSIELATLANFTYSPQFPKSNLKVLFTNTSSGPYDKLEWTFPDGSKSALDTPSYTFDKAGRYTVTLAAYDNKDSLLNVRSKEVDVKPNAVANFKYEPATPRANDTVQFTDLSTGQVDSLFWNFGVSGATSKEKNPQYSYTQKGTYTVVLMAFSGKDTVTVKKTVNVQSGVGIAQTATQNSGVSVYPNPSDEMANISYTLIEASTVKIELVDILGKQVVLKNEGLKLSGNHKAVVNTNQLPEGLYYCRVKAGDVVLTKKFTITH